MKYLNRLIYLNLTASLFGLAVFLVCLTFVQCKKEIEISKNTEGVEEFIENEIEEIDANIDERSADDTPKYQTEAENKVDAVFPVLGTVSEQTTPENYCSGFRYGSYFIPRQECKVLFIYANDNLKNITVSDGVIRNIRKDTRNNKAFYFTLDSMTKNLQLINFTFHLNADAPQKSLRFLENHPTKGFYGTSQWGRMTEREALNLPLNPVSQPQQITSSYIPKLGDVLYFGDREGIISKDLGKNKEGKFKFKIIEWNAKCTGRKITSSRLLFDVTKIVSGNKRDTATRFAR
jgi:hypothetical protein